MVWILNSCSASIEGCTSWTFSPRNEFEYEMLSTPSSRNTLLNVRLPFTLSTPLKFTLASRGVPGQHAGREQRQLVVVAAVQRQVDDLLLIDDRAARRGQRVEQRRRADDLDRLAERPPAASRRCGATCATCSVTPVLHRLLEARCSRPRRVIAGAEAGNDVGAVVRRASVLHTMPV